MSELEQVGASFDLAKDGPRRICVTCLAMLFMREFPNRQNEPGQAKGAVCSIYDW